MGNPKNLGPNISQKPTWGRVGRDELAPKDTTSKCVFYDLIYD
jgi:hypothetical protein